MCTSGQKSVDTPEIVIREFFRSFHPPEIKDILQNWFEEAITKENSIYDEAQQRDLLLWFYKQLAEMLDAAYIMYMNKTGKKKIKNN